MQLLPGIWSTFYCQSTFQDFIASQLFKFYCHTFHGKKFQSWPIFTQNLLHYQEVQTKMNMNISRFSPCVFTQPSQLCTSGNYSDQASYMQLHYSESESLTTVWNSSFKPAVFTETTGSALAKALSKDIGLKLNRPSNKCIKTEIEPTSLNSLV